MKFNVFFNNYICRDLNGFKKKKFGIKRKF